MTWKVGDWVICELEIGQVSEVGAWHSFKNGATELSGDIEPRFRPLTLRNKCIVEYFAKRYASLQEIDGSQGFNFPDIHSHISWLCLQAIDETDVKRHNALCDRVDDFVRDAKKYKPVIQSVALFRNHG
jgi:hypothetical protein